MFELRHFLLPYCLQALPDGTYQVLNRRYEPLMGGEGVKLARALSTEQIAGLAFDGNRAADARGRIYLYADGCIPTDSAVHWRAYSERLKRLSTLRVKT